MNTAREILKFWFETSGPEDWFKKSDAFDSVIRAKFEVQCLEIAGDLIRSGRHSFEEAPDDTLALIIALDQFPRNMYRGTKAMFAWDYLALGASKRAVEKGFDFKIVQARRAFLYMPYMHSENLKDQQACVTLTDARLSDESTLKHAKSHLKVIERFGRFPHRNAALGRTSTAEEISFLNEGGYAP